jgi:hypothetical protein
MYLLLAAVALGLGGFAVYSLTLGQDRSDGPNPPPATPSRLPDRIDTAPKGSTAFALVPPTNNLPVPELGDEHSPESERYHEAQSAVEGGAQWLAGMSQADGKFLYGIHPALNKQLDGDDYLRQLGATIALARAARYLNNPHHAAVATQAVLRFLDDTVTDAKAQHLRYPGPAVAGDPVAAAGLLVQAINELPLPQSDVLEKSEELCAFIRLRQRGDGAILCGADPSQVSQDPAATGAAPGQALCGLMASQRNRPAAWKLDVVHKAMTFYHPWWKAHRSMTAPVSQTAAYAAAFLQTKSQDLADAVLDMNDWLCSLQYSQLDPRHKEWWGGFKSWADDRPVDSVPNVSGCACAEALVEACRVARQLGDVQRYDRQYRPALELWRSFAARLQYVEGNTRHFDPDYRRRNLLGGFHASPDDGTLRIDYTQQAVCAMVQYLTFVVRNT